MINEAIRSFNRLHDSVKAITIRVYDCRKLKIFNAYLLLLIGFHYLYLSKPKMFFLYVLSLGGFGLWFLYSAFKLHHDVKVRNEEIFYETVKDMHLIQDNMLVHLNKFMEERGVA